jgi:DNA-binding response OmpR family regulator
MSPEGELRVLLVDDEANLSPALAPALRERGHAVEVVSRLAASNAARSFAADVVVLAVGPGDGSEDLARSLHGSPAWGPLVVAVTAQPGDDAEEAGAHLVLERPVDPALLLATLRRFSDLVAGEFDGAG